MNKTVIRTYKSSITAMMMRLPKKSKERVAADQCIKTWLNEAKYDGHELHVELKTWRNFDLKKSVYWVLNESDITVCTVVIDKWADGVITHTVSGYGIEKYVSTRYNTMII